MRWILMLALTLACTDRAAERTAVARTPAVPQPSAIATATGHVAATVSAPPEAAVDSAPAVPDVPMPPQDLLRFDAARHPILPWIVRKACEGEDCETQFVAEACAGTTLHADPVETSPIVATIAQGEMVQVVRRDLHVQRAGIIVIKRDHLLDQDLSDEGDVASRTDTLRFARGDTVFALHYLELGRWVWAYHGRVYDSGEFWGVATDDMGSNSRDTSVAVARTQPDRDDWWLVATRAKVVGWWSGTQWELESTFAMRHWGDDCTQIRKRALQS